MKSWLHRLLPRTLFGRVMLILLCGLTAAQALAFGLIWYERARASQSMMLAYVTRDVASAVAILERLPANERTSWLERLDRKNYRYHLGALPPDAEAADERTEIVAAGIAGVLGPAYQIDAVMGADSRPWLSLRLRDGTPLSIELAPVAMPIAEWLPLLLAAQLVLLIFSCWLAVRLATRPLTQLAQAAEALVPEARTHLVPESGPAEVAQAARSFNAMQARIAHYLQERTQILAAISHDLQTPVTRMRLRTELMDDQAERSKWQADLDAMQSLVKEGLAYARSTHAASEPLQRIDPDAFLNAIVEDYRDAGQPVSLHGSIGYALVTRPQALRRLVTNLVDNALKFAGTAEVEARAMKDGLLIAVLDRGPGIPADELDAVLQPFYRVEGSRNSETGGSGLGLAIAQQLSGTLGGTFSISNRAGGGLRACLELTLPHGG